MLRSEDVYISSSCIVISECLKERDRENGECEEVCGRCVFILLCPFLFGVNALYGYPM